MVKAFVFPGQGSQYIGMGKDLYDNFQIARDIFNESDDSLNFKLSNIIFNGEEDVLRQTENTQPALLTMSVAIAEILKQELNLKSADLCRYSAGHSLGEYSALTFANSINFSECTKLVRKRGELMRDAAPNIGSMIAIIGLTDSDKINELIKESTEENEVLVVANDNSIGQIVLSGHNKSIENVFNNAKSFGAKMTVKLPVSGPFHSPILKDASNKLLDYMSNIDISKPDLSVISNVDLKPHFGSDESKATLAKQIISPVRWTETIQYFESNNVTEIIEIGAKNVLSGLTKRITKNIKSSNIETVDQIKEFINSCN